MPIPASMALSLASGGLGLMSSKRRGSGNPASRSIQSLLANSANRLNRTDPYEDVNKALDLARSNTERLGTKILNNVSAKSSFSGSWGWAPDTARSSILRGTLSDISNKSQEMEAEALMGALPRFMQMVQGLIGTASAGRGENLQSSSKFDSKSFIETIGKAMDTAGWKL